MGHQAERRLSLIESLPVELRLQLLLHAPDIATLGAMILACRTFHATYVASRERVLYSVTCKDFSQDDPRDFLSAIWSSTRLDVQGDNSREEVVNFLRLYHAKEEDGPFRSKGIPLQETFALMRLRIARDDIIDHFLDHFLEKGYGKKYESNDGSKIALTVHERRRFHRAIYRWQIYCNIFPSSDSFIGDFFRDLNGSYFDFDERKSLFFAAFAPWEFDELMTVIKHVHDTWDILHHYAWTVQLPVFGLQAVVAPQEGKTNILDLNPHAAKDVGNMDNIDWLTNQGPHLFHGVISTPCHTRDFMDLFLDNVNTSSYPVHGVYTAAASIDESPLLFQYLAPLDQHSLAFRGDDVTDGPNRGWVLMAENWYNTHWQNREYLRVWAVALWDEVTFKSKRIRGFLPDL